MQYLSNREVVSALARLMIKAKSPYTKLTQHDRVKVLGWGNGNEGLHSKIEIVRLTRQGMELDCIQDVLHIPSKFSSKKVQSEILQFNELMSRIQMPVFMWHNTEREALELHWQERLDDLSDMVLVHRMFEQGTLLRNSMEKKLRLNWQGLTSGLTFH